MKRRSKIVTAGFCAAALAIALPVSAFAFGGNGLGIAGVNDAVEQAAYVGSALAENTTSEDSVLQKGHPSDGLSNAFQVSTVNYRTGAGTCGGCGAGYVDADGDGLCDYCASGRDCGYVDADGDGVCDNQAANGVGRGSYYGACQGEGGRNYVDVDGDGVCDNRGSGCDGNGAYVDADGDGVCDSYDSLGNCGSGSACGGRGLHQGGRTA